VRVTVFGSSIPKPGDHDYQAGLALGEMLGREKHTVLTGGYMGVMEAVSRGTAEAGGYVIGVTCDEIETWRPGKANRWVQKELRFRTLNERILCLIKECDALFALPGGVGTLAEISVIWTHMQTGAVKAKPLILIGPGWRTTFNQLYASMDQYILDASRELVSFAPNVKAGFEKLKEMV